MYLSTITATFSAAHYLRNYSGKCENLHGHNWKVEVTVAAEELDVAGMGLDFTILRKRANEILEDYDHKTLNDIAPFNEVNPSSENLARTIFDRMGTLLDEGRVHVRSVKVWESENSWAEYLP